MVDVFVRKLRAKLQKDSPGWGYIHTHFGVGYRFEPEPSAPDAELVAPEPVLEQVTEADRAGLEDVNPAL